MVFLIRQKFCVLFFVFKKEKTITGVKCCWQVKENEDREIWPLGLDMEVTNNPNQRSSRWSSEKKTSQEHFKRELEAASTQHFFQKGFYKGQQTNCSGRDMGVKKGFVKNGIYSQV